MRKISTQRMIFAAIITILILLLGLAIGLLLDVGRLSYSAEENSAQELNYQSLQLQYLYISSLDESTDACPILRAALQESIEELGYSLEEFERYSQDTRLASSRYDDLERKYLQDNLRYWLFSKRLQEECQSDVVNVLYFYSDEDCPTCANQGTILTYFKNKLEDRLLVFPINMDVQQDEQFLNLLSLSYNITDLPTLVVNNETYRGVVSRNELSAIICEQTANRETCLI